MATQSENTSLRLASGKAAVLQAKIAMLRSENLRIPDLQSDIATLQAQIAALRGDHQSKARSLQSEIAMLHGVVADVQAENASLRSENNARYAVKRRTADVPLAGPADLVYGGSPLAPSNSAIAAASLCTPPSCRTASIPVRSLGLRSPALH